MVPLYCEGDFALPRGDVLNPLTTIGRGTCGGGFCSSSVGGMRLLATTRLRNAGHLHGHHASIVTASPDNR